MNICLVVDDGLDKEDGVQQYMATIGPWFARHGHTVSYIAGQTSTPIVPNVYSIGKNIRVKFNKNHLTVPLPVRKKYIIRALAQIKPDIIHIQMPYSPFLGEKVLRYAGAKTAKVGTFHVVPFSWVERSGNRLLGFLERRSLRSLDAIIAVSEPAKSFIQTQVSKAVSVIPNAVDIQAFQSGKKYARYDDKKLTIVFLGRLVERKGCMYLLQAIAELQTRQAADNVRVVICGKGPLEARLKEFAQLHNLQGIVEFVGFINPEEKKNYLASADIAVFPSTGGESFGIVLIEAMAAGAGIVIGGDNAGYRFVLGREELLFKPQDIQAFANLLQNLISNKNMRTDQHQYLAERLKQFDVEQVGTQILELYHKALR